MTQYIPEEYEFKLTVDKGYLYDSPNLTDKTRIYLVRGDQINLLSSKNNFYKIEYTSAIYNQKTIKNTSAKKNFLNQMGVSR